MRVRVIALEFVVFLEAEYEGGALFTPLLSALLVQDVNAERHEDDAH